MGTLCLLTKVTEAGDELDHRPHRLAPAPPLAYYLTYRICLGLQRPHREVLDHGIETASSAGYRMANSSKSTNPSVPSTITATPFPCPTRRPSVPTDEPTRRRGTPCPRLALPARSPSRNRRAPSCPRRQQ